MSNPLMSLPLENLVSISDFSIKEVQKEHTVTFPAMPARAGFIPVLRCQIASYQDTPGGCNFNAQIKINGQYLTRYTENAQERLIGRKSTFGLLHYGDTILDFQIFAGNNLMTIFAPDATAADAEVVDGMGATFLFDISDRVRGVDGNSITFRNIRFPLSPRIDLMVSNITIGYLNQKHFPKEKSLIPERGPVAEKVAMDNLELSMGKQGGFSLHHSLSNLTLNVETLFGMTSGAPVVLRCEDAGTAAENLEITTRKIQNGFELTADLPNGLQLQRRLLLDNHLLKWVEVWRNKGKDVIGVPFRHRFWIQEHETKFYVGGDSDAGIKISTAQNPTVFLEDIVTGNGFGITAENDRMRLLVGIWTDSNLADVYTHHLALASDKEITLELSIDPESGKNGYWGFINRLRHRWLGDTPLTAERPFFCMAFNYKTLPGNDNVEKIRKSYAHLGPIVVSYTDWSRLIPDVNTIHQGKVPVLPDGRPDIEKFLTLAHREPYYQEYQQALKDFAQGAPEAKLIMITHPAMEIVYTPEAEKWPYSADEIKTPNGTCFNEEFYSKAYLYDQVKNGWAIYYYVPSAGSAYLNMLKNDVKRYIEQMHAPGIYFDEFSFASFSRGYCRYNYAKSDGYSADLDSDGKFIRFKSDNAMDSKTAQVELADIVKRNGGVFYANTEPALTSNQNMPVMFFTEGGNGYGTLAGSHLTQVPTAFGNFGDFNTVQGIFYGVKAALAIGTVYSPAGGNLVLEGRDNFVCKLYPITIQEIDSGIIKGRERMVTTSSGNFTWNVPDGPVTLYCYDREGKLLRPLETSTVTERKITLTVPEGGMVIAELTPALAK